MDESEIFEFTNQFTPEGRGVYKNQFGDFVTERTITEFIPSLGGWYNIPSFYDGNLISPDQAVQMIEVNKGIDPVTGRSLERFDDMDKAITSAQSRSTGIGQLLGLKGYQPMNQENQ